MCWSPNRVGAFYAGPALEGTKCGEGGRHCIEGECRGRIQLKIIFLRIKILISIVCFLQ